MHISIFGTTTLIIMNIRQNLPIARLCDAFTKWDSRSYRLEYGCMPKMNMRTSVITQKLLLCLSGVPRFRRLPLLSRPFERKKYILRLTLTVSTLRIYLEQEPPCREAWNGIIFLTL